MTYIIKPAKSLEEITQAEILRAKSFGKKFGLEKEIDKDEFDDLCDHLLLYEFLYGIMKLIGTARIRQFKYHKHPLYASQEFDVKEFKKRMPNTIESGRICTIQEMDSKKTYYAALMLLSGEKEYAIARNIKNFFGCTSFPTKSKKEEDILREAEEIYSYLEQRGATIPRGYLLKSKKDYEGRFNPPLGTNKKLRIPAIADIYLMCGAKIISYPFWDKEFHCIDFLTIGDINAIPPKIQKRLDYVNSFLVFDEKIKKKTRIPLWKNKKENKIITKIKQKPKKRQIKYQKRFKEAG